jgi:hypothetical protein
VAAEFKRPCIRSGRLEPRPLGSMKSRRATQKPHCCWKYLIAAMVLQANSDVSTQLFRD